MLTLQAMSASVHNLVSWPEFCRSFGRDLSQMLPTGEGDRLPSAPGAHDDGEGGSPVAPGSKKGHFIEP